MLQGLQGGQLGHFLLGLELENVHVALQGQLLALVPLPASLDFLVDFGQAVGITFVIQHEPLVGVLDLVKLAVQHAQSSVHFLLPEYAQPVPNLYRLVLNRGQEVLQQLPVLGLQVLN